MALRVRVLVFDERRFFESCYVVVSPQVVADLVNVRQVQDAVHVDDGIGVRGKFLRRFLHHVPAPGGERAEKRTGK